MPALKDMTGQTFGRLLVIEKAPSRKKNVYWRCVCECGNEVVTQGNALRGGVTKSCGCLNRELAPLKGKKNATHHMSDTRPYHIWRNMRARCNNPKAINYHVYGGRGIKVCDEWNNSFARFWEWASANGYADNLTLDRIDNDKGYSPDNCRWATMQEQQNRRRNNHIITINGISHTAAEWCAEYNIPQSTFFNRIKRGITGERLLWALIQEE